ncbi:MAG: DUF3857 domain-containing protein [Sphingomonadales bacterium]|nr:DUF3857 domain-containing protein [Sphingomonadales bacterium]
MRRHARRSICAGANLGLAAPTPTLNAAPEGGPFRVTYNDTQVRFTDKGTETYSAYRLKILAPEALDAGKISLTWNPDGGEATVHLINIIRDDKRIDVLATDKFLVIQREEGLEASMLDGQLTATMQIPGLRVGDEIEFAITIRQRDKTLGNHFSARDNCQSLNCLDLFEFGSTGLRKGR